MSEKARDKQNRWRSMSVGVRVSPEEWEQINMMVYTSGLQKQEYLIRRVLQQDITIVPNPRVQKALRMHLEKVYEELKKLNNIDSAHDELLDTIQYLAAVIDRVSECP